ncbi:MAG: hypothetical protein LBT87_01015 [Treponema sp.]|jgi:hypothetical protein|nr:hypothetical protein [Treponema sp.]
MAAAGGAMNMFSRQEEARQAAEELKKRKAVAEKQKDLDLEEAGLNYAFAREQGLDSAARSDEAMDLRENLVSLAYNAAIGDRQAAMEARGFENQLALIQGDSAIEGAYANLGAGGIRPAASAAGAIERQAAVSEQALRHTMRAQERQDENALIGAYASLAENKAGIGEARYQADRTRRSFEAGGENYEKYEFARKRINETWDKQQEYYQTLQDNTEYSWVDGVADFFGGAVSGFNAGMNIASYAAKYGGGGSGGSSSGTGGGTAQSSYTGVPAANQSAYGYEYATDWNTLFQPAGTPTANLPAYAPATLGKYYPLNY